MKQQVKQVLLIVSWLIFSTTASAETHTVKGVGVQFKPELVFADKGDVVAYRDMPTHFVHGIKIPDDAEKMSSQMGANYDYKIKEEGVYLYSCPPHWGGRMGGLILVGEGLRDEDKLIDSLTEYQKSVSDKIAQGYLKKVIKKIKGGKIKIPK